MKLLLNKSEVLAFYLIILRQTLLISFFSLPYPFSSSMSVMQIRTRGLSLHCLALKITVGLQMRPVGRLLKILLFFFLFLEKSSEVKIVYVTSVSILVFLAAEWPKKHVLCIYSVVQGKKEEMRYS